MRSRSIVARLLFVTALCAASGTSAQDGARRGSWRAALPALTLPARLSEAQLARTRECVEMSHAREPDATAEDLSRAADCLAAIPAPGREIRVRRVLTTRHPNSPLMPSTLRELGMRYEQIGHASIAIRYLREYVRRYPAAPDARAHGQRAVCLARELGAGSDVEELLRLLARNYGRRGFVRPSAARLGVLCGDPAE